MVTERCWKILRSFLPTVCEKMPGTMKTWIWRKLQHGNPFWKLSIFHFYPSIFWGSVWLASFSRMLNQLQGELENDLMIQLDEDICEIRSVETGRIQDRSREILCLVSRLPSKNKFSSSIQQLGLSMELQFRHHKSESASFLENSRMKLYTSSFNMLDNVRCMECPITNL